MTAVKLAVSHASIVQIDLTMHTDDRLRGYVLAWSPGLNRVEYGADYVVWPVTEDRHEREFVCESGRYFHLSPGYTDDDQILALSQAQAYFNDRRGVTPPPF